MSGFDSSKAGSKTITVSYNTTSDGTTKFIGSDSFQVKVTNDGKNPFDSNTGGGDTGETEEDSEPVYVTVHWIDGEFEDLTHEMAVSRQIPLSFRSPSVLNSTLSLAAASSIK